MQNTSLKLLLIFCYFKFEYAQNVAHPSFFSIRMATFLLEANLVKIMDALLNRLSISAKREIQSLCCMMGKTMSSSMTLRCQFLVDNGRRLID